MNQQNDNEIIKDGNFNDSSRLCEELLITGVKLPR